MNLCCHSAANQPPFIFIGENMRNKKQSTNRREPIMSRTFYYSPEDRAFLSAIGAFVDSAKTQDPLLPSTVHQTVSKWKKGYKLSTDKATLQTYEKLDNDLSRSLELICLKNGLTDETINFVLDEFFTHKMQKGPAKDRVRCDNYLSYYQISKEKCTRNINAYIGTTAPDSYRKYYSVKEEFMADLTKNTEDKEERKDNSNGFECARNISIIREVNPDIYRSAEDIAFEKDDEMEYEASVTFSDNMFHSIVQSLLAKNKALTAYIFSLRMTGIVKLDELDQRLSSLNPERFCDDFTKVYERIAKTNEFTVQPDLLKEGINNEAIASELRELTAMTTKKRRQYISNHSQKRNFRFLLKDDDFMRRLRERNAYLHLA